MIVLTIIMAWSVYADETAPQASNDVTTGISYEENKFTNEECITDETWMADATTSYELNKETGLFVLTGTKYSDMSDEERASHYIVYGISETGKTLYGYIPNYSTKIQSDTSRDALSELEIITTSSCTDTLKVAKTVIGGEFNNDEEYLQSQDYDDDAIRAQEDRNNAPEEATTTDNNNDNDNNTDDTTYDRGVSGELIQVPNAGSVISVMFIAIGATLFVVGICFMLKPELLASLTNNNKKSNKKKNLLIILIALLMLSGGIITNGNAETSNVPEITEIEKSEIEDLALTVKWDSKNIGSAYTVELVNETTGFKNRFSNRVTEYTYQGLEVGKDYKIKMRVCTSEQEEDCSAWSNQRERRYDRQLKAIILNYKNAALLENNTLQLEVIQYIPKSTTDDRTIIWTTNNTDVATVDANGLVTAKKEGEAVIAATSSNGKTATCNIKVTKIAINLKSIKLNKTKMKTRKKKKKR